MLLRFKIWEKNCMFIQSKVSFWNWLISLNIAVTCSGVDLSYCELSCINMGGTVLCADFIPFGEIPESEKELGHMVGISSDFWGISMLFHNVCTTFHSDYQCIRVHFFPRIFSSTYFLKIGWLLWGKTSLWFLMHFSDG